MSEEDDLKDMMDFPGTLFRNLQQWQSSKHKDPEWPNPFHNREEEKTSHFQSSHEPDSADNKFNPVWRKSET
ncbi:hypothetical protein SRHO_G00120390 [Serrasalmus rhombeus]